MDAVFVYAGPRDPAAPESRRNLAVQLSPCGSSIYQYAFRIF